MIFVVTAETVYLDGCADQVYYFLRDDWVDPDPLELLFLAEAVSDLVFRLLPELDDLAEGADFLDELTDSLL
jgi:hypothetical protein